MAVAIGWWLGRIQAAVLQEYSVPGLSAGGRLFHLCSAWWVVNVSHRDWSSYISSHTGVPVFDIQCASVVFGVASVVLASGLRKLRVWKGEKSLQPRGTCRIIPQCLLGFAW